MLLLNINIYTEYILIGRPNCTLAGKENIFLHKKFLYNRKLKDINELDTCFLNCKQKHMMKSVAPPDKIGVLHRLLPIEFHGFTSRIDF